MICRLHVRASARSDQGKFEAQPQLPKTLQNTVCSANLDQTFRCWRRRHDLRKFAKMKLRSFCENCQTLLSCRWRRDEQPLWGDLSYSGHAADDEPLGHRTIDSISQSASEGCQLCELMKSQPQNNKGEEIYQPRLMGWKTGEFELRIDRSIKFYLLSPAHIRLKDSTKMLEMDGRRFVLPVQKWLAGCHLGHDKCKAWAKHGIQSRDTAPGPARLLLVDGEDEASICVVDNTSSATDVRYSTLSHCWGASLPVRLTSRTCARMYAGISCSTLPLTFQHAVQVTRQLGLAYLWIDALCILQDSDEDWNTEAPKMAAIYSQSYVNLAATASFDSNGGLFCQRPTPETSWHEIPVTWSGLEEAIESMAIIPTRSWASVVDDSPLNKRAWVLQERALAPRTVHFAADTIRWQCHEVCGSEQIAGGPYSAVLNLESAISPRFAHWKYLVKDYSGLALSKSSDKLTAFAGLARLYASLHALDPGCYVAGLWEHDFPTCLLWVSWGELRPLRHEVPSWSWASTASPVILPHPDGLPLCDVKRFCVKRISNDLFSSVASGSLRIQSYLIPFTVQGERICRDPEGARVWVSVDKNLQARYSVEQLGFWPEYPINSAYIDYDRADPEIDQHLQDVYFLPVLKQELYISDDYDSSDFKVTGKYRGILIKPASDQRGTFRRIAHMSILYSKDTWDEAIRNLRPLDERLYQDKLEDGRYEFDLT